MYITSCFYGERFSSAHVGCKQRRKRGCLTGEGDYRSLTQRLSTIFHSYTYSTSRPKRSNTLCKRRDEVSD